MNITGRKENIILNAWGKNVTPENLENDLKQCAVHLAGGDVRRPPYQVALLTLTPEAIIPWARERGLPDDLGTLSQHPEVHSLWQVACDSANSHYAQVEQVKASRSSTTGELTATLRVKRTVVYERYAEVFDQLYAR